jgi:hypothetical protein
MENSFGSPQNPDSHLSSSPDSPTGITVVQRDGQLSIIYRWFMGGYVAGVVFFLLLLLGYALLAKLDFADSSSRGEVAVVLGLVFGPFLFAGLYWCIAAIFNTTTIGTRNTRDGNRLVEASNGPFPWPGNRTICAAGLVAIHSHHWSFYLIGTARHDSFDVMGVYANGERKRIVRGLPSASHADYVTERLARHLGLPSVLQVKRPAS